MDKNNEILSQRPAASDTLYSDMSSTQTDSAKWNVPCVFHRTKRMPYDEKSVFSTYQELLDYIADAQTTSYPGMIVSIAGLNEEKKGVYVLLSNGTTLVPTALGGSSSSSSSSSTTTCSCKWIVNPTEIEQVNDSTWYATNGETYTTAEIRTLLGLEETDADPIGEVTITVDEKSYEAYQNYTPTHIISNGSEWVEGSWSNWTIHTTDGELNVTSQTITSNIWSLTASDGSIYTGEQESTNKAVMPVYLSSDSTKVGVATREWIAD